MSLIYMCKEDLEFTNEQWVICNKTKPIEWEVLNQTPNYKADEIFINFACRSSKIKTSSYLWNGKDDWVQIRNKIICI